MRKTGKQLSHDLPEFPHTLVLGDDLSILSHPGLVIQEKIDGASVGAMLLDGHPVIRNRDHIMNKGFMKDTPAKLQFRPIWGWFYENRKKFEKLNKLFEYPVGVYAEWLWNLHGIVYDQLPDWFVAYDLYDPSLHTFIDARKSRKILEDVGFAVVPLLHEGPVDLVQLENFCNEKSEFSSTDRREGVYLKASDGRFVVQRAKLIREGYVQGCKWNPEEITKQGLKK